mmetsp:Transcript_28271/g.60655  ORF Transcript_28271/g.60655 Transcript_28271/m.60655 type:complete len:211 (+) Transcript_28271:218-850(+)
MELTMLLLFQSPMTTITMKRLPPRKHHHHVDLRRCIHRLEVVAAEERIEVEIIRNDVIIETTRLGEVEVEAVRVGVHKSLPIRLLVVTVTGAKAKGILTIRILAMGADDLPVGKERLAIHKKGEIHFLLQVKMRIAPAVTKMATNPVDAVVLKMVEDTMIVEGEGKNLEEVEEVGKGTMEIRQRPHLQPLKNRVNRNTVTRSERTSLISM